MNECDTYRRASGVEKCTAVIAVRSSSTVLKRPVVH